MVRSLPRVLFILFSFVLITGLVIEIEIALGASDVDGNLRLSRRRVWDGRGTFCCSVLLPS